MSRFELKRTDGSLVGEGVHFDEGPAVLWVKTKHRAVLVYEDKATLEAAAAEAGWELVWETVWPQH